jgi:CoA:oxalate CoA-transferase
MCDAIGLSELKDQPRFRTNALRTANHDALELLLSEHFARQPRAFWLDRLTEAAVPAAPVNNLEEVSRNPHLAARNMILHAEHPSFSGLIVPGSPLKSTGSDAVPNTRAPQLGEHTEQVLGGLLGYDSDRLGRLRREGII